MSIPNCQLVLKTGSGGYQVFNIHLRPRTVISSVESVQNLIFDSTEGNLAQIVKPRLFFFSLAGR